MGESSLQVRRTRYDCRMRSWTRLRRVFLTFIFAGECQTLWSSCARIDGFQTILERAEIGDGPVERARSDSRRFVRRKRTFQLTLPQKGARLAHTLETDSYEESVYSDDATVEEVFGGPGRLL